MATRGDRLTEVKTQLQSKLQDAIGTRSIYQAASDWGIPHWVLVDTLRGKVDCPSPKYLRQIAKGLGWSVEDVIAAAYSSRLEAVPA